MAGVSYADVGSPGRPSTGSWERNSFTSPSPVANQLKKTCSGREPSSVSSISTLPSASTGVKVTSRDTGSGPVSGAPSHRTSDTTGFWLGVVVARNVTRRTPRSVPSGVPLPSVAS
ncbi:hypothetical protein MYXA107069_31580 [Myxococcus xanthus]